MEPNLWKSIINKKEKTSKIRLTYCIIKVSNQRYVDLGFG